MYDVTSEYGCSAECVVSMYCADELSVGSKVALCAASVDSESCKPLVRSFQAEPMYEVAFEYGCNPDCVGPEYCAVGLGVSSTVVVLLVIDDIPCSKVINTSTSTRAGPMSRLACAKSHSAMQVSNKMDGGIVMHILTVCLVSCASSRSLYQSMFAARKANSRQGGSRTDLTGPPPTT
jgi:hypothetical protein